MVADLNAENYRKPLNFHFPKNQLSSSLYGYTKIGIGFRLAAEYLETGASKTPEIRKPWFSK
jgi:hypothetical protein